MRGRIFCLSIATNESINLEFIAYKLQIFLPIVLKFQVESEIRYVKLDNPA